MIIIGAGSAGLFYAIKKAELGGKGRDSGKITVVEEHKEPGKPVQCTGILTDEIKKLLPGHEIKKFTLNRITNAAIHSPNRKLFLKMKENLIIDNSSFVQLLAQKAEKLGVKIETERKFVDNSGGEVRIRDLKKNRTYTTRTDELVGADGPMSAVAFHNGMYGERKHLVGIQARIRINKNEAENFSKNNISFYPYIGEYAWCVPENDEVARVGVALPLKDEREKNKVFGDFLKKYPGTILEKQGGLIPLHQPNMKVASVHSDFSVALVGDAALQIKNTTGGGIIPGMKAAEILAGGIDEYRKNLRPLNKELYMHYLLGKAFRNYRPNDWDRLLRKAENEKIRNILMETNRDNARKIIFRLALHPSMITEGLRALGKMG